jgi:hypothetical protein
MRRRPTAARNQAPYGLTNNSGGGMPIPTGRPGAQERLAAIHATLTAAVADLASSDAWQRMLTLAARTRSPGSSRAHRVLAAAWRRS